MTRIITSERGLFFRYCRFENEENSLPNRFRLFLSNLSHPTSSPPLLSSTLPFFTFVNRTCFCSSWCDNIVAYVRICTQRYCFCYGKYYSFCANSWINARKNIIYKRKKIINTTVTQHCVQKCNVYPHVCRIKCRKTNGQNNQISTENINFNNLYAHQNKLVHRWPHFTYQWNKILLAMLKGIFLNWDAFFRTKSQNVH